MKDNHVEEFHGKDKLHCYVAWVRTNTEGFVANSTPRKKDGSWRRQVREGDPRIHRATCEKSIVRQLDNNPTQSYTKICSNNLDELQKKLQAEMKRGMSEFSFCKQCRPDETI